MHWDKIKTLQKNSLKNVLFFVLRAATHHSFTFNLRFLYDLKHKVCLCETEREIFHFRIRVIFIKVYIFCLIKCILRLVWNGSRDDLSLRRPQDVFQKTSERRLPGNELKTSSRRCPQDLLKGVFKTFSGNSKRPLGDRIRTFYLRKF